MRCDGGAEIWNQLDLSGEPPVIEKLEDLGTGPENPMSILRFQDNCLRRKEYRASHAAYWESTKGITGTGTLSSLHVSPFLASIPPGSPVDAMIMPVAPTAAVIPGKYFHYGTVSPSADSICHINRLQATQR